MSAERVSLINVDVQPLLINSADDNRTMADIFDIEKRSSIMKNIKSKNSKAELIVFRYLRVHGIYFQKHYSKAPGRPDVALPRKKIAVFVDGDFWHGRTLESLRQRRPDPDDFWVMKIERNVERDRQQEAELERAGWKVLRVWESDIVRKRTSGQVLATVADHLVRSDVRSMR